MSSRTLVHYLSLAVLVVAVSMLTGCADMAAARATAPMSERMQGNFTGASQPSVNSVMVCGGNGMYGSTCTRHSMQDLREALSRRVPGH